MIKEFCAENHGQVVAALEQGAQRIELCDNLAVGGTTPSYGVVQYVCHLAHERQATVMTMIRPRGGDFCYHPEEIEMMVVDCKIARSLGSDGVVFGVLTREGWLDEAAIERLVTAAGDGQVVFHMAFDQIPRSRQLEAIDWLAAHGVTRILTRGHTSGCALDHVDWLETLVEHARDKIEILVGGGLTVTNVEEVARRLNLTQVHGTRLFW